LPHIQDSGDVPKALAALRVVLQRLRVLEGLPVHEVQRQGVPSEMVGRAAISSTFAGIGWLCALWAAGIAIADTFLSVRTHLQPMAGA
jgi:hypothetical protein